MRERYSAKVLAVLLSVIVANLALAIDSGKAFDDPAMQARYERLIAEVRCVTCQNQSIKDSNAYIATDLRREIRRLMGEGKSNPEIADFLVTRYGDFVLYRPRTDGKMLLLWIAPFLLIAFGFVAFFRIVKHRMALPIDVDEGSSQ